MSLRVSIALLLTLSPGVAVFGFGAQYTPATADWNKPVKAFRIIGNIYYVGASEVSLFLITTPKGHILLDSGFAETVPLIQNCFKQLGLPQ